MKILIHREDKAYGPYSLEQVEAFIAQKLVKRNDLAWIDEAGKWQPVENLIIQASFRQQRAAYLATKNAAPGKRSGKSRHARRWLWKPE